ncbi:MAG TPA: intradiol ring-cleavage dioxygenase [Polyangiaceae bacterium]|nr:intradiol ring-cleavage dioxygenase [Polyangiaceae bacterium]
MSGHDRERGPFDRGLAEDLQIWKQVLGRRRLLQWAACSAGLVACGGSSSNQGRGSELTPADGRCNGTIPEETAGPFPGDGTNNNGSNALTLDGILRSDVRSSVAGASGVAEGVPLTVRLTILGADCAPLADHAVYIWHCDREGRYSMYSPGAQDENYLRGVQVTGAEGVVEFSTIFPACYPGRWPHVHFEVYSSLGAATSGRNAVATSQLALPEDSCGEVFATSGYEASASNLKQLSLATDLVFADGASLQTPVIMGSVSAGYVVTLPVTLRAG